MRFWKRRLSLVTIFMVGATSLNPVWKLIICGPLMVWLSIDWDDWNYREEMES